MQTYKLHTLLLFFKAQQKLKYEAIEIILGIIENDSLSDEDKTDGILFILHRYGLNEVTYKNGDYEPKIESCELPEEDMRELDKENYQCCFITELMPLKALNGNFLYEIALN